MASPHADHDSSEQTPLLAGAAQPSPGRGRSFLPSLLPAWCRASAADTRDAPHALRPDQDHDARHHSANVPHRPTPLGAGPDYGLAGTVRSRALSGGAPVPSPASSSADTAAAGADPRPDYEHDQERASAAWGAPAGLEPRPPGDENVVLFRQAVGIPTRGGGGGASAQAHDPEGGGPSLDHARQQATGIYGRILAEQQTRHWQAALLHGVINACHVAQILVGAVLTTLGPSARDHAAAITVLGATNTVLAGLFVLLKGRGLLDRLRDDAAALRQVQDWIEETDALLVAGVVGRNRREVGRLVETAFQKYNAVVASHEAARPPESAPGAPEQPAAPVPAAAGQPLLGGRAGGVGGDGDEDGGEGPTGAAGGTGTERPTGEHDNGEAAVPAVQVDGGGQDGRRTG